MTPCGAGGLQRYPGKVSLQAHRFAYALLGARAVVASPVATGNKKAQSHHTPVALGHGRLRLQ